MAKTSHDMDFSPLQDGEVGWIQVYRELVRRATSYEVRAAGTIQEYMWNPTLTSQRARR